MRKIKRKQNALLMLLLITALISMAACSAKEEDNQTEVSLSAVEEDMTAAERVNSETEDSAETETGDQSSTAENSDAPVQDAVVSYTGESFTKSLFAVGDTKMYLCGIRDGEYFFGSMDQEGNVFEEFSLNMGENMRAFRLYVDEEEHCHILWFRSETVTLNGQELDSVSFEESCITVIDSAGAVLETIDATAFFWEEQAVPFSFVVDHDGNYWFEEGLYLVSLSSDGTLNQRIECPGAVEVVGIGASGWVYAIYQENGERYLGNVMNDGTFGKECSLPDTGSGFSLIAAGTDGVDVLLYHTGEGVYGYDRNTVKHLISAEELPVTGEDANGYGFLADGRLCLMGPEDSSGGRMFYYLRTHCMDFVVFMR